jgi:hypothetical protein
MKPVTQTKFSLFYADGRRFNYGNCLVACIASILEIEIDEVPNVNVFYGIQETDVEDQALWLSYLNAWLFHKHSLKLIKTHDPKKLPGSYFICRGQSYRALPHCIVMHSIKAPFDPHPTREGLKSIDHYYYFVDI